MGRLTSASTALGRTLRQSMSDRLVPTSLLSILLRHSRSVLAIVIAFTAVGLLFSRVAATSYEATAELIVQDPRAASAFDVTEGRPSTQDSERYLADQVRILESSIVIGDVADRLGEDTEDVAESLEVVGDLTSNLIEVKYSAPTREEAVEGANGLVDAYVRVVAAQVRTNASVALAKIDALQATVDATIESISATIDSRLEQNTSLLEVEAEISGTITKLNRLRRERDALPFGSPQRDELVARVGEVAGDLAALRLSLDLEVADPELDALIAERAENMTLGSQLDTRRNTIEVDLELASANLALVSPARLPGDPSGLPAWVILAGFIGLGAVAAAAAAYALDLVVLGGETAAASESPASVDPHPVDIHDGGGTFWPLFDDGPPASRADEPEVDPDPVVEPAPPVSSALAAPHLRPVFELPEIGTQSAWVGTTGIEAERNPTPGLDEPEGSGHAGDDSEKLAFEPAGTPDDRGRAPAGDPKEPDQSERLGEDVDQHRSEASAGVGPSTGTEEPVVAPDEPEQTGPSEYQLASEWFAGEPLALDPGSETAVETATTDDGHGGGRPAAKDDLTVIRGVGTNVAALLEECGIVRFSDLAELSIEELKDILAAGGPRFALCNPESWPLQARLASHGRWLALKALAVADDDGGRKS